MRVCFPCMLFCPISASSRVGTKLGTCVINAQFLSALLPDFPICEGPSYRAPGILDPHSIARTDENSSRPLPHSWNVTSDSLALRAARLHDAGELILLKSTPKPDDMDWFLAAQLGLVDPFFPTELRQSSSAPAVRWVNFRAWQSD